MISTQAQEAMGEAVEHIEREIANLRAIITELRPAALDELGLRTAIEALLDRHREQSGFQIDGELVLPGPSAGEERLDEDLETAVYRLRSGGAHERRQARPGEQGARSCQRSPRASCWSRCRTTAPALTPRPRATASGWRGCTSE